MANIEYRIPCDFKPGEPIVLIEFTRNDLEKLVYLYPPDDNFTREVRDAMRYLDSLQTEDKDA